MADLKISAATPNPAPAGTDNFATDKSGADFRTSLAQVNAFILASAGDVFKVGTPANTEVGVWTGDGTIKGDPNLEWNGATLLNAAGGGEIGGSLAAAGRVVNGTASSTFATLRPRATDTNTGIGSSALDVMNFITGGVNRAFVNASGFSVATGQLFLPGYSFPSADGSADQILSTDGAGVLSFKDQAPGGGLLSVKYLFDTATAAADPGPGNIRFNNATPSLVTAIYIDAIDENALDVSNILNLITTNDRLYIQSKEDATDFLVFNVTAPITDNTGWFTITGTVEASGNLPTNGEEQLVVLQIGGAASGGGDVFKVGTPVNDQLPVWTGDGTIEGSANFNVIGASLEAVNANGPALKNVAVSFSVPTVLVDRADANTGLGGSPGDTNLLSLIVNGNEAGRGSHISGVPQFSVGDGTVTRPGLSFISDTLSGLARLASSEVSIVAASTEIARFGALGMDTRGLNIFNGDTTTLPLSITAGSDGTGIGGTLTLRAGASGASGAKGGSVLIEATNGAGGGAEGGDVTLNCGNASGSGDDGGDFLAMAGAGIGGGGTGGNATVEAGTHNGGGIGGIASLIGGEGNNGTGIGGAAKVIGGLGGTNGGDGANAEVTGGAGVSAASDGDGGDAVITGGAGAGTGADGEVILAVVGATNIVFDPTSGRLEQGAETFAYLSERRVVNDAAQARRTTVYALTTAFVDITMDTTDIETDAAVIDHDLVTNTDNIIFGEAGTYEITYDMEVICTAVSGDPVIDMGCRVRLNDLGTGIAGSHANPYSYRDGSVGGDDGNIQKHISNTFLVTVAATDFITLQLDKTEITGTATFNVSKICMKARRLT